MMQPTFLLLFTSLAFTIPTIAKVKTLTIPNSLYDGPIVAGYSSLGKNIDGQKISPYVNETTYEWWYFDVISTSSANESITLVFYEKGPEGFIPGLGDIPLLVQAILTVKNGSSYTVLTSVSTNASAVITASDSTISGDWQTTGFSFTGTKGLTEYVVTINSPELDIYGTVTSKGVAPGHLPCGTNSKGATELLVPNVGWANIIPGAVSTVDLTFQGEKTHYTGVGYHDKNWGDAAFVSAVKNWYWGHAAMGPYTLVWFDTEASNEKEYVSGYVAKNGVIQTSTCVLGHHSVRPWGANSTYPPTPETGKAQGLLITYTLDDEKTLSVNLTTGIPIAETENYARYISTLEGSIEGSNESTYSGKGIWEVFKF